MSCQDAAFPIVSHFMKMCLKSFKTPVSSIKYLCFYDNSFCFCNKNAKLFSLSFIHIKKRFIPLLMSTDIDKEHADDMKSYFDLFLYK